MTGISCNRLNTRCTVKDCKDCPSSVPGKVDYTFWEAWFVKKGAQLESNRTTGRTTYTDQSNFQSIDNKCGYLSAVGVIQFFCSTTTGDLGKSGMPNPKSGWTVNASYGTGNCATSPGWLPSTDKEPNWWNNAPIERCGKVLLPLLELLLP